MATLEAWIDYSATERRLVGGGGDVECTRIDVRWAVWATNQCRGPGGACDESDSVELTLTGRATHDIETPAGLAECRLVGDRIPRTEDFAVRVSAATDEDLVEVLPPPTVEVTGIDCRATSSTTS